jgi:hypothetical protein
MDSKDKAIRLLASMLNELVSSYDNRQRLLENPEALICADREFNEKLSSARSFLNQISRSSTLNETTSIGESIDVQVSRGIVS